MQTDSEMLDWKKHHYLPRRPFLGVGLQSAFDRGAELSFDTETLSPFMVATASEDCVKRFFEEGSWDKKAIETLLGKRKNGGNSMIYRTIKPDHRTDKVYHPAEFGMTNEKRNAGSLFFAQYISEPEANFHQIEFQHRNSWAVAGRHGEEDAFGLSYDNNPYLRLAFPNETDRFPDTFILVEVKTKFTVIKFSSDFTRPDKFKVGEPVVVNWEIVYIDVAPDCLKKAVEENTEKRSKSEGFINSFAQRRGYEAGLT